MHEAYQIALAFVGIVGLLVFIHELGHYWAARKLGIHVERFSVGFGNPIWERTDAKGTVWSVGWIPLGGYVVLHGHVPPSTPERAAKMREGQTFHDRPVSHRAAVVAGGPIANFLLAALLFAGLFVTNGKPRVEPIITQVIESGPAYRAGVQTGERITSVNGTTVLTLTDFRREMLNSGGQNVMLGLKNEEGESRNLSVQVDERNGSGYIGVRIGRMGYEPINAYFATLSGIWYTVESSGLILLGLWEMATAQRGVEEIGGPLRIATMSGEVSRQGLSELITLAAFLSINLGLLNLLPIPALDGGHLVFYAIEALRRKALSQRAMDVCTQSGIGVLICLMVFATWNDISSLLMGHSLTGGRP
jgi:regulator of sigma E protease